MTTTEKTRPGADDYAAEIATALAAILGKEAVAPTDNFFELGGDSLSAMQLMVAVEARFGLVIEPAEIFERPLLKDFAAYLAGLEDAA